MVCSNCGIGGHNKRTCPKKQVKKVVATPPQLPTSIFAEWVDRGVGAWMDASSVPTHHTAPAAVIQLTNSKTSCMEVEIGLLCLVKGLPTDAQNIIVKEVFCNRLPVLHHAQLPVALKVRNMRMDFRREAKKTISVLNDEWGKMTGKQVVKERCHFVASQHQRYGERDAGRIHSIVKASCYVQKTAKWGDYWTHYAIEQKAKMEFGKGNSTAKKHAQLYYEAINEIAQNSASIYTDVRDSHHLFIEDNGGRRPFKRLTRGSWEDTTH